METIRRYYILSKPGIIYGNILHVIAGLALAVRFSWSWTAAVAVIIGSGLVMASACVLNNLYDRDIDMRMKRTAHRPSAVRSVSVIGALVYALALVVIGLAILVLWTNWLTVWLGIVAYISYAVIYTYSKHHTVHSTLIGTLPGALPAVAGYTALSGQLDYTAVLIGVLVAIWQLPHFYAIAVFRSSEYKAAGIRLLSHVLTKKEMVRLISLLVAGYTVLALTFVASGMIGWVGGSVLMAGSLWWLWVTTQSAADTDRWARKVFYVSLSVCLIFVAASLINLVLSRVI